MTLDTGDPQLAQKGLPWRTSAPHDGQCGVTRAPQLAQKGLSPGVSPWHTSHCMVAPLARHSRTLRREIVQFCVVIDAVAQ